MRKREVIVPICWILLGTTISVWASTFPFGTRKAPGPAFLPFILGLLIILLGGVLLIRAISSIKDHSLERAAPSIRGREGLLRVGLTLGGMFVAAFLIDTLGFVVTIFCLILLLLRTVEPRKWRVDMFYVVVFTFGSYLLFQVLLKVALPRGVFRF